MISLSNVFFRYDANHGDILKNISLSIHKGEWLAIMGHNGSGKSTLAKLLNGLLLPTDGTLFIENLMTTNEEDLWEIRKQIGFVFQNPDNQIVASTVRDDIAFGLENIGIEREIMIQRIEASARMVGLHELLDAEPYRLSGGQKQRLAIAGVFAITPKVMIFDEATSMLDPIGRKEVLKTINDLKEKEKITIVSITHDLEEATMADRILVMNQGEIYKLGTPKEVFQDGKGLKNIGLDLPITVQIHQMLVEKGVLQTEVSLTQEELVENLWKLEWKA